MLTVSNLTFWYDTAKSPLIYRCNFEVREREFVAIVGESGGGKTTLLHLCCGLLQAQLDDNIECRYHIEGTVRFNGEEVKKPHPLFSYVPQKYQAALHPVKTAKDNVLMAVLEDGNSQHETILADHLLETCGILDQANINVRRLSGGQQQRVAICRALIKEPSLLLMDEPFANLDFTLKPHMQVLLSGLRDKHPLSVLLVTHDIESAVSLADKIVGVKQTYGIPEHQYWTTAHSNKVELRRHIEDWIGA